jgi:dolichol-phosphate hexosyltransferase
MEPELDGYGMHSACPHPRANVDERGTRDSDLQHARFSRGGGGVRENGDIELAALGLLGVRLSIVMPVYNEQRTIALAVSDVFRTKFPCEFELIVVDDGSSDETSRVLADFLGHPKLTIISHTINRGKGAALRTGAAAATGTHLVPFDSDLEYEPADLVAMLEPLLHGRCQVVYGARVFGVNTRYQSYRHAMGNRALTLAANVLFDSYISDMHTCLKLLPVTLFRELRLAESGFGLDTELTAKILKMGIRPFEVPVRYHSRSPVEGKKITWRAGVECLRILGRVRRGPGKCQQVEEVSATFPAPFMDAQKHSSLGATADPRAAATFS